ncbi:MAG: nicotinamide riboside transporter PnuC [Steroidobacteraceae bacterium]
MLLQQVLEGLRASSPAELVSTVFGVVYAVLVVQQRRSCWIWGAISSALLVWLDLRAALPMQALLQAYYVVMAAYGYWHWGRTAGETPAITTWPPARHALLLLVIAVATALLAPQVGELTRAAWPRLDTATLLASLLATWMVTRMLLENWLWWIAIDLVSMYLYAAQGLMFIALLYLLYLGIAVTGFVTWRRRLRTATAPG